MKITFSLPLTLLVTSVSVSAAPNTNEMFKYFDLDKNNELTLKEFQNAGVDSEGSDWSKDLSSVCSEKVLKMVEPELITTFNLLDENNDKKVTPKEFHENSVKAYDDYWQVSFKKADTNNDKLLSNQEYIKQANQFVVKLKESYEDANVPVECKADVEYWQGYYQGLNNYADDSFDYLDDNKDKQLSYVEYIGNHLR